jgi:hypothetical protein
VQRKEAIMRKRLNLTVSGDVYEDIKFLPMPRGVSISELVSWILKAMAEDVKPGGMSEKEFIKYMDSDPRGREVRKYLQDKIGPILERAEGVRQKGGKKR